MTILNLALITLAIAVGVIGGLVIASVRGGKKNPDDDDDD